MSFFSAKQLEEVVQKVEARHEAPIPVDDTTMVKTYGAQEHILVRSQMAGCEGELVVHSKSLIRLAQVLLELGKSRTPVEQEEVKGKK